MLRQKKGSHVGVVISFVTFILFLVFVYSILSPSIEIGQNKNVILNELKLNFEEEGSVGKIIVLIITINSEDIKNNEKNCININRNSLADLENKDNLIIRDNSGKALEYEIKGSSGNSLWIGPDLDLHSDVLLKFYYSGLSENSMGDPGNGCESIDNSAITRSSLKEEKNQPYQSEILNLVAEYESNYGGLKNKLNIPDDTEFWFNFTYSNGTSIWPPVKTIPQNVNVYSEEDYILYLDKDATKQIGFIDYRIW